MIITPSANFTRPSNTTQYAVGDLVANNTTAGSVTPLSWTVGVFDHGSLFIRRVNLKKSATSVTSASFRLHLYTSSPTVTNGDNSAWVSTHSGYIGSMDVTVDKAFSATSGGIGVPLIGAEINVYPTTNTLYGLLEARATYTPASAEVFTAVLELHQER